MKTRELSKRVGNRPACQALGVPESSYYRRLSGKPTGQKQPRKVPARTLSQEERKEVLACLCSERFVDRAPGEVVPTLLDEGRYLCSERTMYRILSAEHQVRERRDQRRHPEYVKPELVATGPNQVWSWDITKLKGPQTWSLFYLYVLLDIYSRYVVGWMIASHECSKLAQRLIGESCDKHQIEPEQLVLHSDRGGPMTAKGTAQLLAQLSITRSLSRPRVSNDNPFSESQFKTLKYCPEFPRRFGSIEDARAFCQRFFAWYNQQHRHTGISRLTPEDVHFGRAQAVVDNRTQVLVDAWQRHPERFPNGKPEAKKLDRAVWINRPEDEARAIELLTN